MPYYRFYSILLAFVNVLLRLPASVRSQSSCLSPTTIVFEQTVAINTEILSDTTFYPLPGVPVTISNAPTSLDTVTSFQWTSTQMPDHSTSASRVIQSSMSTLSPADDAFVLRITQHSPSGRRLKRHSGGTYVSGTGTVINDCTTSPIYSTRNGSLTATTNGTTYIYSTSTGIGAAAFAPSTIPRDFTTSFSISSNGALQWTNSAFFNGQASFCVLQNGTVYAVFAQGAQPDGCLFIQLTLYSVSSCQGMSFATITGPPGPQVGRTQAHRSLDACYDTVFLVLGKHRRDRTTGKPRHTRYAGCSRDPRVSTNEECQQLGLATDNH